MTTRTITILIAIFVFGCAENTSHDAGANSRPRPEDSYSLRWACADPSVRIPFADTNIMLWRPADVGGFFWLYHDSVFVAGGQIGGTLAACWELRFAGQPVVMAVACPTGNGFSGYAIYRDTIAQKEARCDFVAER